MNKENSKITEVLIKVNNDIAKLREEETCDGLIKGYVEYGNIYSVDYNNGELYVETVLQVSSFNHNKKREVCDVAIMSEKEFVKNTPKYVKAHNRKKGIYIPDEWAANKVCRLFLSEGMEVKRIILIKTYIL